MFFGLARSRWGRRYAGIYLVLALGALAIGIQRLIVSTEMPGLAAIELVLVALPWSLLS